MSQNHLCGTRNCSTVAAYLAVLKFNDGDISYLKIFEDLDIKPGMFTRQGAQKYDQMSWNRNEIVRLDGP